ncbi:MAG: serine/threonine-protein kinase [Planctomycetota bacterium]
MPLREEMLYFKQELVLFEVLRHYAFSVSQKMMNPIERKKIEKIQDEISTEIQKTNAEAQPSEFSKRTVKDFTDVFEKEGIRTEAVPSNMSINPTEKMSPPQEASTRTQSQTVVEEKTIEKALSTPEQTLIDMDPTQALKGFSFGDNKRYTILSFLAEGGMGATFVAYDQKTNKEVVVKIIKTSALSSEGIERFAREIRSLIYLSDVEGITQFLDAGEFIYRSKKIVFYVMEYVKGATLRALLKEGEQPLIWIIEIFIQLARYLYQIHQKGIIHRDIKPQNIMIDKGTGKPKFLDFGIAKIYEESSAFVGLTRSKDLIGTTTFMAPEQAENPKSVNSQSDIFSLGHVFYFTLTGQIAINYKDLYHFNDNIQGMKKALKFQLENLNFNFDLYPAMDEEFQQIVRKVLAPDPKDRYATGEAFAQALETYRDIRKSWTGHKLMQSGTLPILILETSYLSIDANNQFQLMTSSPTESTPLLAEFIPFGEVCSLEAKTPISVNSQILLIGDNRELQDGDKIQWESKILYYKKYKN